MQCFLKWNCKNRTSFLKKIFIIFIASIFGYLSLLFFLGNEGNKIIKNENQKDVQLRKNFLVKRLSDYNYIESLYQKLDSQQAGEWIFGSYSMATYALTNIAMRSPQTAKESSNVIASWIDNVLKPEIKNFDKTAWSEDPLAESTLQKDRGHIAYYGHLNLMLGAYALLNNDGKYRDLHLKLADAISRRLSKYPHRHAETYPFETYPMDNTVAVASLSIADKTLGTDNKLLISEWVQQEKNIEDPELGLPAYQIDYENGHVLYAVRGAGIGWNSFFLPFIDEEYAKQQFENYKRHMLIDFPSFAFFKESPNGDWFAMDQDSGPVLLGVGQPQRDSPLLGHLGQKIRFFYPIY